MSKDVTVRNDFLPELLTLQQDGRHAISAPCNWDVPPLLEVEADYDDVIGELSESIRESDSSKSARWHFFIGSPGNGKSAAIGKLYRNLTRSGEFLAFDEDKREVSSLLPDEIPRTIRIHRKGKKFAVAHIVQDASVVKEPYAAQVDPAQDLCDTLKDVWRHGASLIVCTNRGVLEKAFRDRYRDEEIRKQAWFKLLSALVKEDKNGLSSPRRFTKSSRKLVFSSVKVSYTYVDRSSLVIGCDTLKKLIDEATREEHWNICGTCPVRTLCPFKANRDWLSDEELQTRLFSLFRRAEVLSGQSIVFREALALISLLLAGHPDDYASEHPCVWVSNLVKQRDIFSLASRRIYMTLFASHFPRGLEQGENLRRKQLTFLENLAHSGSLEDMGVKDAVTATYENPHPSEDVGVKRLLGSAGIFSILDPCLDELPAEFFDRWDSDYQTAQDNGRRHFTRLEEECAQVWGHLEENLDKLTHQQPESQWALRRWSSSFLLHFGALYEGRSRWSSELDGFVDHLEVATKKSQTKADKEKMMILNERLQGLLDSASSRRDGSAIQLSDAVELFGQWVRSNLKPRTAKQEGSGSVSLSIEFGQDQQKESATLGANLYVWLVNFATGTLYEECFPQELLAGARDARVRAAASGRYAYETDGVTVRIKDEEGNYRYELKRADGEVFLRDLRGTS